MADVIRKATNKFTKGLVMDFSPENTQNEVLTHALNATLLTFNGNELALQNDMGNARVETAFLPEGYMPVGTCEYGGIIYIVSYNPLEDKSQIGCFPSPERNVSSDELGIPGKSISRDSFQQRDKNGNLTGDITNTSTYVLLKNDNLNPGDKFLVCADKTILNERLADLFVKTGSDSDFRPISNPMIALNVVSIEDSGKIVYLNSDLRKYDVTSSYIGDGSNVAASATYRYHILGDAGQTDGEFNQAALDIDNYRNVLSSGYSVFKSKTSGKLAILAELITIDSYSVTHSVVPEKDEEGNIIDGSFDVIIHSEVLPEVTTANVDTVPKLQYYYLKNSQGYLQAADENATITKTMFSIDDSNKKASFNDNFLRTTLSEIYVPTTDRELELGKSLSDTGEFNFPTPFTYHGKVNSTGGDNSSVSAGKTITKFTAGKYHRIMKSQVYTGSQQDFIDYWSGEIRARFYKYDTSQSEYSEVPKSSQLSNLYTYYIQVPNVEYIDAERNVSNKNKELYMLLSEPTLASKEIWKNELVEKYVKQETHTYKKATLQDIEDGKTVYQETSDGNYDSIANPDKNNISQYYTMEISYTYISVGYESISEGQYSEDIYYYPSTKNYTEASEDVLNKYWDLETYPKQPTAPWGSTMLYYKKSKPTYRVATSEELLNYSTSGITLYYQPVYKYLSPNEIVNFSDSQNQLFIVVPMDSYIPETKFKANTSYNYIEGNARPPIRFNSPSKYPYDDPLIQYTVSDFIPTNLNDNSEFLKYEDIKLANIKIPALISVNGLDLPFKYDYTLVPCMSYGRLDHLAVSNTVDFSKLHAFNQSDFTTWKYHIDGNQLRLTFGTEIFDTYETNKVDGLILEFYDLWGFAGSLEITDKKSYSGLFTKILPLNAIGALSKNRIEDTTYNSNFKRNINIREKADKSGFTLNDKDISFTGFTDGWTISEDDNDCGALYSNIVYGVKAYIRRTTSEGFEFIKKKDFFLYTLPIYNDYYYTVNDFSGLTNPQLDFMLTYKVKDSSIRTTFSELGLENGYNALDNENIKKYVSGYYEGTALDVTKFYKYSGTSEVHLEIGLKPDYQNLNVSYSPDVNKYFTCDLQLVSDNDENVHYTIKHDDTLTTLQALGYDKVDGILDTSVNKLGFGNEFVVTKPVESSEFYNSNFINISDRGDSFKSTPIPIKYEFIIGYTANITDIRATEVPATTVCALFHKNNEGEYNYEDFGIYVQEDSNGNSLYLSKNMFYTGGTRDTELCGICSLVNVSSSASMIEQCQESFSVERESQKISYAGKLHSGESLKQLMTYVGKLTFCQPHAHGFSETNGVNVFSSNTSGIYTIPSGNGTWPKYGSKGDTEASFGVAPNPNNYLFKNPRYNLILNTENSVSNYSELISVSEYGSMKGNAYGYNVAGDDEQHWVSDIPSRTFVGLTASEIETFNRKLIKTMSEVYVYNPDYDSLMVNVGNVSTADKPIDFVSHLVSTNSKLEFTEGTSLNDFIYLGPIKFSDYIKGLNEYSVNYNNETVSITVENSTELLPQLQFAPGLDLCGVSNTYNLVTSLTYNTQTPIGFEDELSFKSSDNIIVKNTEGENTFLEGKIDKKALYGYYNGKLVQLDVSNYYIEPDGSLHLSSNTSSGSVDLDVELTPSNIDQCVEGAIYLDHTFEAEEGGTSDFTASILLRAETGRIIATGGREGRNGIIVAKNRSYGDIYTGITLKPSIYINSKTSGYSYSATVNAVEYSVEGKLLNPDKVTIWSSDNNKYVLSGVSYSNLSRLVGDSSEYTTFFSGYGPVSNTSLWESPNAVEHSIYTDQSRGSRVTSGTYTGSKPNFYIGLSGSDAAIEVYDIHINKIYFTIERKASIDLLDDSVIKTSRTTNYANKLDRKYTVDSKYDNPSGKSTRIRGTSITLNDLVYKPNVEGHRLFVRNNICTHDSINRGKIFYRSLTDAGSWVLDTQYLNSLYIFTGPCFTPDNL